MATDPVCWRPKSVSYRWKSSCKYIAIDDSLSSNPYPRHTYAQERQVGASAQHQMHRETQRRDAFDGTVYITGTECGHALECQRGGREAEGNRFMRLSTPHASAQILVSRSPMYSESTEARQVRWSMINGVLGWL